MGLAGVIETSSKLESEMENIQDAFYICACNCVSKAKEQEEIEKEQQVEIQAAIEKME
jgi:hypothetical protein